MSAPINTATPSSDLLPCPGNYAATAPTTLKCAHCLRPLMVKDAKRTHNGYVCPYYVKSRVATFYNATALHHVALGALMLVLGVFVGLGLRLVTSIPFGIYLTILAAPAAGAGLAEIARRVFGKTRGQYFWLVAAICVALGAAPLLLVPLVSAFLGGGFGSIYALLPLGGLALLIGTLVSRMRI